jgi:hypothetical protein
LPSFPAEARINADHDRVATLESKAETYRILEMRQIHLSRFVENATRIAEQRHIET